MKLAFIADIHIGSGRQWYSDLEAESPFYLQRHKKVLQEIIDKIITSNITYVILGGDLLDKNKPTSKEYNLLAWFLLTLAEQAQVNIISGNHEDIDAHITCLHPARAFCTHSNIKWHLDLEATNECFGRVLWASHMFTGRISETLDTDPEIDHVVAHYAAKGCFYDNHSQAMKGWEFNYRADRIKQWFLGDIHLRQAIGSNAFYPGSICQLNFGEGGQKGFEIYDTDTRQREQVPLISAIPLKTEKIYDKLPDFNPAVLYRVQTISKFLDYAYPTNVISIQLLEEKQDTTAEEIVVDNQIDFGDPLSGLNTVLERNKLEPEIIEMAVKEAQEIIKNHAN
jgi:DNA repair exonuclease SbcCD nuclease subunit